MENKKKKCSLNKHSESEAISYCQQCKIYLCNKCHNIHPEVHDNHNLILLDNELNEIFIDICKEDAHNNKLDFFCKNHNTLCCVSCLCKFKIKGYGQHSECYTCYIDDIKDEKKNNLKENINHLEYLSKIFEQLKILFEDGDKFKEEKKLFIVDLFDCLRNKLNEYQNQLLKDIDEIYNNNYVNKDIVIES